MLSLAAVLSLQHGINQQSLQKFATCLQHIAQLLECPVCCDVSMMYGVSRFACELHIDEATRLWAASCQLLAFSSSFSLSLYNLAAPSSARTKLSWAVGACLPFVVLVPAAVR